MVDKIKLLLGLTDTSKDEILSLLKERAVEYAIARSGSNEIEYIMPNTIIKMVIYDYNRLGTEGLKNESYGDITYSYVEGDYPQDILYMLDSAKGKFYVI